MRYGVAAFLLFFLLSFQSNAVTGTYAPAVSGTFTDYSNSTIGSVTPVLIVPANNARKYLVLENVSAVNMGCSYSSTPVIGTAGTVTLVPNGSWTFDGNFIYSGTVYCIAASSSNNVMVALEGN